MPDHDIVAYIFLGKDNTVLYSEPCSFDGIQMQRILSNLKAAGSKYETKVIKKLDDADQDFGEYWEEGQMKGVCKVGSKVFNKACAGGQSCLGTIVEMNNDGSKSKVLWDNRSEPSRKFGKTSVLFPVPVREPQMPTKVGQMAIICGGFVPELYGKRVRIERISQSNDIATVVLDKSGRKRERIYLKHLHYEGDIAEGAPKRKFHRAFLIKASLEGKENIKRFVNALSLPEKGRWRFYYYVGPRKCPVGAGSMIDSGQPTHFESAIESISSSYSTCDNDEFSLLHLNGQLEAFKERMKITVSQLAASSLMEDCIEEKFSQLLGGDHVDVWVAFLRFRYPLELNGLHVVSSTWFPMLFDMQGNPNSNYFGENSQNLETCFEKYITRLNLQEYKPVLILIPVVLHYHWSLIIIGNPFVAEETFAIHVDSLESMGIGGMLRFDWTVIQKFLGSMCPQNAKLIHTEASNVPKQSDSYNCGPYTLLFMELISTEFQNGALTEASHLLSKEKTETVLKDSHIAVSTIRCLRFMIADLATAARKRQDSDDDDISIMFQD